MFIPLLRTLTGEEIAMVRGRSDRNVGRRRGQMFSVEK